MARARWLMLLGVLAACDSPSRARMDHAYASSASDVLASRSSYFEASGGRVCLTERLGRVARRVVSQEGPVSSCDTTNEPGPSSGEAVTLWTHDSVPTWEYAWDETYRMTEATGLGVRKEPLITYWFRRLFTHPPRGVRTAIYYSDGQVASARFDCWLSDVRGAWVPQECVPTEVRWRAAPSDEPTPVGCWAFSWTGPNTAPTAGLPDAGVLTQTPAESLWWEEEATYRVDPYAGGDSAWAAWDVGERRPGSGFDWRWGHAGPGVFRLRAGGGFEGIEIVFLRSPEGPTLRGVGAYWTDTGTYPSWTFRARPIECEVFSQPAT